MFIRKVINWRWCAAIAAVGVSSLAYAAPITLRPTGSAAQDGFVYQSMPAFNFKNSGFQQFIVIGKSTVSHDLNGLIRFDLAGASLAANEKATLNFWVGDMAATGLPSVSPSTLGAAVVDVAPATSAWQPSSVTWATAPSTGAVAASETIDGIGRWVSFDVTDLVDQWIDGSITNYGVVLTQRAPVNHNGWVGVVFDSSSATNAPFLQIAAVPEPTSIAAAALGCALFLRRNRG